MVSTINQGDHMKPFDRNDIDLPEESICLDCDWEGDDNEILADEFGDDHCPKCMGESVVDHPYWKKVG